MVIKGPKQEADKSLLYKKSFRLKKHFSGKSPDVLIGSFGYPFVNLGALSSEDKVSSDPKDYLDANLNIDSILKERQSLINSKLVVPVRKLGLKFVEQTQEIARTNKVLDTEVELDKPLSFKPSFNQLNLPHGPSAQLQKLEITSSASVKPFVERLTSDTDVSASDALLELSKKHLGEYKLTQLLSTGLLGKNRRIVPTKWSITAIDDTLSKQLHKQIILYDDYDFNLFYGELYGNKFIIFTLPGLWSFELMEFTKPNTIHNSSDDLILSHDYEIAQTRKEYVKETAGAFYAARLAVLEYLNSLKKQARVIIFRIITEDYTAPLGVWVVREGVRKTLNNRLVQLNNDPKAILTNIKQFLLENNISSPDDLLKQSIILREKQTNLKDWLG